MDVDAEAGQLLERAALPRRGPLIDDAAGYLRRTRLGRRYGLIGGLMLGLGPLAGDTELSLALPRMLAGDVLGLLVSESLPRRRDRPARRAAELRVRRAADLLPGWARAAVWVVFIPALASPLLILVHPVSGLSHVSTPVYTCGFRRAVIMAGPAGAGRGGGRRRGRAGGRAAHAGPAGPAATSRR